jgi:pentatricopeptide repeat protein
MHVLEEMSATHDDGNNRPVMADVYTFNLLIRACERDGLLSEALALYSAMVDGVRISGHKAPPPDVVTYNSLVKVCEAARDWRQAGRLFERMKVRVNSPRSRLFYAAGGPSRSITWPFEVLCCHADPPNVLSFRAVWIIGWVSPCEGCVFFVCRRTAYGRISTPSLV